METIRDSSTEKHGLLHMFRHSVSSQAFSFSREGQTKQYCKITLENGMHYKITNETITSLHERATNGY